MTPKLALQAEGIQKVFRRDDRTTLGVLRDLSIQVKPAERVAIIGKSGSGKSTLLHILGTLERPTSGKILFGGEDVSRFSENRMAYFRNQQIGFVFQFHYLMLEFTALENVMIPALIGGASRDKANEMAHGWLKRVGLTDRATHKPAQLSGGEQQRVAIARALMMRPKLLLTDEMTGNLDPVTGNAIFELMLEMQNEHGMAMISVTHDEKLAGRYHRVLRLTDGRLV